MIPLPGYSMIHPSICHAQAISQQLLHTKKHDLIKWFKKKRSLKNKNKKIKIISPQMQYIAHADLAASSFFKTS